MPDGEYFGPEKRGADSGRRSSDDLCLRHAKHATLLNEHDKEIIEIKTDVKVLEAEMIGRLKDRVSKVDLHEIMGDVKVVEADMKSKVSMRLFIACMVILVGMSGFVYSQLHAIDKQVTQILTRQESIRATVADSNLALQGTMKDLQQQIRFLSQYNHGSKGENK
jgi:hypothetical protein